MKISDTLKLPTGSNVDSVEGVIRGVYTKNPTASQQKHDIHPQDVVIDQDGSSIRVVIMRKGMHIPENSKGAHIGFASTPSENGAPRGLTMDVYNNVPKIQADGQASITMAPVSKEKQEAKPQARNKELPMPPEVSTTPASDGRVTWRDHADCLVEIVKHMDLKLADTGMPSGADYNDILTRLSTTVYIQAAKENLIKKPRQVPQQVVTMVQEAQHSEASEPEVLTERPMKVSEIIDLSFKGKLTADLIGRLSQVPDQYNWEAIYDQVEAKLAEKYDKKDIHSAYDESKAFYTRRTKKFDNQDFCKTILSGIESFKEGIEAAAALRKLDSKPKTKEPDPLNDSYREDGTAGGEDDIPF